MIPSIERLAESTFRTKNIDCIKIRRAQPGDAEEISNLYRRSFPEHILVHQGILSDPDKMEEQLKVPNKYWLVAEEKGDICGCAAIEVADWNKAAEIERVVVDERHRGNGIATDLCKELTSVAETIGVEYIFAHCRGPEIGMQRALEKQNFEVMGIMPVFHVVHNGKVIRENFVYMAKLLNNAWVNIESKDELIPAAEAVRIAIKQPYRVAEALEGYKPRERDIGNTQSGCG